MATNYDLKLVVDADTTEAQRKLDALAEAHNSPEVQAAAERARSAMPQPQDGRARSPSAPTPSRPATTPTPKTPTAQNAPDDFGKKAGDVAGRMIGKAVAGFMAHEVAGTIFTALKTPGGDNRTINQAEAGVGGAMRYGTMGAMLGGPMGAVIGGISGAIMGVFQERQRQQKAVEARDAAIKYEDFGRVRNSAVGAADSAFGKSLELAGGRRQRQEMIRARRDEIANGEGAWSVKNLAKQLKGLDPESYQGKYVASNLQMQKDRVASLNRQLLDEGLSVAPSRLEAGSVADSWAKRGVQIGAQVDVAQVNDKIMGEVQNCRTLLEKIANMATDGSTTGGMFGIGRMLKAVYD